MKITDAIPRVHRPSLEQFVEEFSSQKKAVILEGAIDTWGGLKWDLEKLHHKVGAKFFSYRTEEGRKSALMMEKLEQLLNANTTNPPGYLRNINVRRDFPELIDDLKPKILYMKNNWRNHWAWPDKWPAHVDKDLIELFISGVGVNFPRLHIDYWGMDTFVCQLKGKKEFILYSVEDSPFLYTAKNNPLESLVEDFINPDLEKFPDLAKTTQYRVVLGPGDVLYNPGWWHTTRTLETSITVIMAHWSKHNYPAFIQEIKRVYKDCNKVKTGMVVTYFMMLGHLLAEMT